MIICDYIKKINSPLSKVYKGDELVMTTDRHYLTFTALQAGSTVKFNRTGVTSEYSTDGGNTWNNADNVTVTLSNIKDTVMYRGVTTNPSSSDSTPAFTLTGQIKAFGNVTSMINSDPYDTSLNNKNHAFRYYFYNQSALKDISKLILPSSSTLTEGCYTSMFEGTGITTIPNNFLRATTLANSCYQGMFSGCTGITTVQTNLLPASTLAQYCYSNMFGGCTGLTNVPNLPATTLAIGCYSHMFENCSGLTTISENYLPVTRIRDNCYASMFAGCTKITTAPTLPATYLANSCYQQMFDGCTKLNEVRTYAENIEATNCIDNWLNNVASTGNFYNIGDATYTIGGSGIPTGWTEHIPPQPLSFTALEAGSTVKFSREGVTSEYSTDYGNTWNSADDVTVTLYNIGDRVMYRGITSSPAGSISYGPPAAFTLTGQIKASGVINSMMNKNPEDTNLRGMGYVFCEYFENQTALKDINKLRLPSTTLTTSCYRGMFGGTGITTIPNNFLPATSLATYCYMSMFPRCTSLTTLPTNLLPARTLANRCYQSMFYGCTSLTTVLNLPATTLKNYCYANMFDGCASLTTVPNLPATTLAGDCYSLMFASCTSLTTLPTNLLPATDLTQECYSSMFASCTGLTNVPTLPATTLASDCYHSMFSRCTSLTTLPTNLLPAKNLAVGCYDSMFEGCTGLTTAPSELPATDLKDYCYRYMFKGCTNLTAAPELSSATLVKSCYKEMFNGCSKLKKIRTWAMSISATECLKDWLKDVRSTGDFYNLGRASYPSGASGIPEGWTEHN